MTTFDTFNLRRGNGLTYREIQDITSTVLDESMICSICLENIEAGTVVKVLPLCYHKFHINCIDPWLLQNAHCPYCRSIVEPLDSNK